MSEKEAEQARSYQEHIRKSRMFLTAVGVSFTIYVGVVIVMCFFSHAEESETDAINRQSCLEHGGRIADLQGPGYIGHEWVCVE